MAKQKSQVDQRLAQLEAQRQARWAAMTPEQRAAVEARRARIEAVPGGRRGTFFQVDRLASLARSLQSQLPEALDLLTPEERTALEAVAQQIVAARSKA